MSKYILSLTFVLIFIGVYQKGSFSAEFTDRDACERVVTAIKDKTSSLLNGKSWVLLDCYPKGD